MIIKSHIRGGFRDAAAYLKEQGQNEKTRLVEMSDPHAQNLDDAFRAMWSVSSGTKVKKPLHHISINPMMDERLTDGQVRRICERLEEKFGYAHGDHQRVIVEHVKEGRQHFHVIWNRVSLRAGKPHWPYMHKKQSKIVAREMEIELGLKKPVSRRARMKINIKSIPVKVHRAKTTKTIPKKKLKPVRKTAQSRPIQAEQQLSEMPNTAAHHFILSRDITVRPPCHYAGMLGEETELYPKKNRSGKDGKGEGAGGGVSSALSALKFSTKKPVRIKRYKRKGTIGTPNRRHKYVWVAVERRENRPRIS
jgi:hypothetical protein